MSLTFSSFFRVSLTSLSDGSLDGNLYLALAADLAFVAEEAVNTGIVMFSESLSLSESESESLTKTGKSK